MALKNKYQRQKEQYSTDGGITWLDVTPPNYRKGNIIEMGSDDCNTIEWIEVEGSWFCIGTDTVTRWVIATNEYMCSNGNKYQKEKEQISYDNGVTWSDTGNARTGSLIEADSEDCIYETQYLSTEMLGNGTIQLATYVNAGTASTEPLTNIKYSKNNGTWTSIQYGQNINVVNGDVIRWKSDAYVSSGIYSTSIYSDMRGTKTRFVSDVNFNVYGNIKSLLYSDDFVNNHSNSERYDYLFYNANVIDASKLILSEDMSKSCYNFMFFNCNLLTKTPVLPTTLTQACYTSMFSHCTSLVNAPILPATTLANGCYSYMFSWCTSLVNAPILPATTLANGCYNSMFLGCTSLKYIKAMFTTTPSDSYTNQWVLDVSATGTFVKNSAASWNVRGDYGIPNGWTVQTASE